jgi:plasmid stabilization system protein ParE
MVLSPPQGLDLEFMQCIDAALTRIYSNPRVFPVVYGSLRRAVVRRFPFAILYEITAEEIQIIAVFHSRRNFDVWKSCVS